MVDSRLNRLLLAELVRLRLREVFGDVAAPLVYDVPHNITLPDGDRIEQTLDVAERDYRIQRIDGLPPSKVTPRKPEELARIRKDAADARWLNASERTRDDLEAEAAALLEPPDHLLPRHVAIQSE